EGRIACVANRSTSVRKAVRPMTKVRSNAPEEWLPMSIGASIIRDMSVMTAFLGEKRGDAPRGVEAPPGAAAVSHIVVVLVVQDVADVEDDGLGALVLPPVRRALHLGT